MAENHVHLPVTSNIHGYSEDRSLTATWQQGTTPTHFFFFQHEADIWDADTVQGVLHKTKKQSKYSFSSDSTEQNNYFSKTNHPRLEPRHDLHFHFFSRHLLKDYNLSATGVCIGTFFFSFSFQAYHSSLREIENNHLKQYIKWF